MSDEMISTIEVRGKVYPLATMRSDDQHAIRYDYHGNACRTGHEPMTLIVSVTADGARELYLSTTNPTPCRISFFGKVAYVGRAVAMGYGTNPTQTDLYIDAITAVRDIPAIPTLDEPTAPADIDWSEIRSATEARDWRRAWQAVGTDHAGDATPGETYLLSKAARAKATAAALVAWRNALLEPRLAPARRAFDPLNADHVERQPQFEQRHRKAMTSEAHALDAHDESWQRIKRIAGWTSQARAQYDERGNRRGRLQAALRDGLSRATQIPARVLFGDSLTGSRYNVGMVDDPVDPELYGDGRGVVGVLNNPFLSAAANRGEITGTVTIPPGTSRSIAAMLATQARLTGGAAMNVEREGNTITITATDPDMIRWQRPDPAAATSHVGIATHATNPNPRGPQTRRRSRT